MIFMQIFTISVNLLSIPDNQVSFWYHFSFCLKNILKQMLRSFGNEYSQFSFIWICPYITLITKKYFSWLYTILFFQHFKNVLPFLPTSMVSDEKFSIIQVIVPVQVMSYFSGSFQYFFVFIFPNYYGMPGYQFLSVYPVSGSLTLYVYIFH